MAFDGGNIGFSIYIGLGGIHNIRHLIIQTLDEPGKIKKTPNIHNIEEEKK